MKQKTRKIVITDHARERLKERVMSYAPYDSWKTYVTIAKNKGIGLDKLTEDQRELWHKYHARSNNNIIRFFNGYCFVFYRHQTKTTLVTVYKHKIKEKED